MDAIRQAGTVAGRAGDAREDAWKASVKACRALERAVVRELDGEPLRGLANIGTAKHPFYAARVRGKPDERLPLPELDRPTMPFDLPGPAVAPPPVLCINPHGLLVVAGFVFRPDGTIVDVASSPAEDEDLLAEDAEGLASCLAVVLPRHVARADGAGDKFRRFAKFAARIVEMLGERGEP